MTSGQRKALSQLHRIESASSGEFQILAELEAKTGNVNVAFSIRIGAIEQKPGGLRLREREEFVVIIRPDFPFSIPGLVVLHDRFGSFSHVVWTTTICLYQSEVEWNPADGLFGFLDRLKSWLGKAALNDMDPVEGPLEPPHHLMSSSETPFVIRADSPVAAGESWFGLAELRVYPQRIEVIAWHSDPTRISADSKLALAVILPKRLPMEFPQKGAQFFAELFKQGFDKLRVVRNLALAALLTPKGEPIHLIMGLPMRRSAEGFDKMHFAVWTAAAELAEQLKHVLPESSDTATVLSLREDISEILYNVLAKGTVAWSRVLEDRNEIVVRRDSATPAAWLRNKKILILGCGALGSWTAEFVARAGPTAVCLVDHAIVQPGLLARQNYAAENIGSSKVSALAQRLVAIDDRITVVPRQEDAFGFIGNHQLNEFDLVIDCTASRSFQMKLERHWRSLARRTAMMLSLITDATAQHCLTVAVPRNSAVGPWGAYVQLKRQLCLTSRYGDVIEAFYDERAGTRGLFQPEPGCSDPTFSGSALDVASLSSSSLNIALKQFPNNRSPFGVVFSSGARETSASKAEVVSLSQLRDVKVGNYRVRIAPSIFREARAWVEQNNRIRSPEHETGGLLWGLWDDALDIVWIFALSGPPEDSIHEPSRFVCGVAGTAEEHSRRMQLSRGSCGFVGFWHTHPDMAADQSIVDLCGMSDLVARQNQRRALMLIFGRAGRRSAAGIYIYESEDKRHQTEIISFKPKHLILPMAVV